MKELRLAMKDIQLLDLLSNLGPDSYLDIKSNGKSVHVVRKLLGRDNIITARGIGYRVTDEGRRKAKSVLMEVLKHE